MQVRVKDFQGFRFGKIHTSDLNLEVVSVSNRYEARTLPNPVDTTSDIPGGDGQYYFGSLNKNREITCNVAFDNVSESDYRKIKQLFATDKLQDLVFDEEPYKTWRAKIKSKPEFKSLCFTDKETGKRVYKGDGRLVFVCYFPYAYGFDKYIVRAADYYMLNTPECIIREQESEEDNIFIQSNRKREDELPEDIRYHYNLNPSDYEGGENSKKERDKDHQNRGYRTWKPNGEKPWKTGFPTIEQVQKGELFFDTDNGEKTIINTRGYWDNVPEWQDTAKLLTTPTLDYDQELMYLPQYSKINYVNMETGFDNSTSMIGSRVLVYNPGDLPIDWEIRFDENKRGFWSTRGGARFRIRRFNVERLPIPCAVDWCGLTTLEEEDNEPYKYGTKYFKRRELNLEEISERFGRLFDGKTEEQVKQTLQNINLWILKPVEEYTLHSPEWSNTKYYSPYNILSLIKKGIIPVDKNIGETSQGTEYGYSQKYTWKELRDMAINDRIGHNSDEWAKSCSSSFDLRLKEENGWGALLNTTVMLKDLGEAHPQHCYYVEPIPRERLDHFIKLFYWQTIQWRGTKTADGQLIELDNWKKMLPKDFFDQTKLINDEYYVKDINNPLIPFLSNFIRFLDDGKMEIRNDLISNNLREVYLDLDFEDGIAFANRYREMYDECIDELEEYELYWDTLKKLLSIIAKKMYKIISQKNPEIDENVKLFNEREEDFINDFINSYINRPLEYIGSDMRDLNYGDFIFNGYKMPDWMTEDYIEIDQSKLSNVDLIKEYLAATENDTGAIFTGKIMYYKEEERQKLIDNGNYASLIKRMDDALRIGGCLNDLLDDYYYVNSDNHMLYTTANPYGMEFVYKPNKVVMNDAITQGKWFKLPPGWSLIAIEPIVDETTWGGKRWEDARPFDYGYSGDFEGRKREVQQLFDYVFDQARKEFFKSYPIDKLINDHIILKENIVDYDNAIAGVEDGINGTEDPVDELLKFKIWYNKYLETFPSNDYYLINSYYKKLQNEAEYSLLKTIHSLWSVISPYFSWTAQRGVYLEPTRYQTSIPTWIWVNQDPTDEDYDVTGKPLRCINGDISDWWWYACNFFWSNFPPIYWAMADMLNKIQIKYTPLYY